MRPFDEGNHLHWVTQLAAVLVLMFTLPLSARISVIASTLALFPPISAELFRRWRMRGTRFTVTETQLSLADEATTMLLDDVSANIFPSRGCWRVTWCFAHRQIMGSAVSEAEAAVLRGLLGKHARTW